MNGKTSLLLDTNVVIGFLNGDKAITHFFSTKASQKTFTVSQITLWSYLVFLKLVMMKK